KTVRRKKRMKLKLFTVVFAAVFLLLGCQGTTNKDTQEGQGNNSIFERTGNTGDNVTRKTRDNARDNVGVRDNRGVRDNLDDRNRHSNNRNTNNTQDKYDVSKEAADRIVKEVTDIDQAYV